MLLPKFTIRNLLLLTLACGIFFAVLAAAARGHEWAISVSTPILILVAGLLLQMLTYLLAYYLSALTAGARPRDDSNPFADDRPSEQLLPPQEQEW